MLRRGATDRAGGRAQSATIEADGRWVERYAPAVTTYASRICGPDRAESLTRRALAELAGGADPEPSRTAAAVAVGRAARAAVLGELAARPPGRGLRRLVRSASRCARTPGQLRARAEGEISNASLDGLYRHLDRCERCAGLAARCDLAEWYLEAELAGPEPVAGNGSGGYRRQTPPPLRRPAEISAARRVGVNAGGALSHWGGPAEAGGGRGARRIFGALGGGRGRRSVLTAAGLVAVVVALGYLALGATGPGGRRVARIAGPAATPTFPRPAPSVAGVGVHGLRVPFVVGGARFAVFRNPRQGWTAFERTDPGAGRRWLAVTVRVRNLAMAGFDPRVLDFRVVGRGGASYAAEPGLGTEPAARQPPQPLAVGGLAEARIGVRIPVSAGDLLLRFRPSRGAPAITVALGR